MSWTASYTSHPITSIWRQLNSLCLHVSVGLPFKIESFFLFFFTSAFHPFYWSFTYFTYSVQYNEIQFQTFLCCLAFFLMSYFWFNNWTLSNSWYLIFYFHIFDSFLCFGIYFSDCWSRNSIQLFLTVRVCASLFAHPVFFAHMLFHYFVLIPDFATGYLCSVES